MTTVDRAIANALTADYQSRPPATDRPETVIVDVPPDSRLEALLCIRDQRKGEADAAKAAYDDVRDGIEAELHKMYPGDAAPTKGFEVPGSAMWKTLSVTWVDGKEYLPTDLIKAHIPQVWDAFKKTSKGYWLQTTRKGKR